MIIKQIIQAGLSALTLAAALYCGAAGAHGKVAMEEDTCMRRLGDNSMVHLSAYQPQHEPRARGHRCHYPTQKSGGKRPWRRIVWRSAHDLPWSKGDGLSNECEAE